MHQVLLILIHRPLFFDVFELLSNLLPRPLEIGRLVRLCPLVFGPTVYSCQQSDITRNENHG